MITKGLIFKIKLSRYWRIEIYNYWEWNGYENMGDLEMWDLGFVAVIKYTIEL